MSPGSKHLIGGHPFLGNLVEVLRIPNSQPQGCQQRWCEAAMAQIVGMQIQLVLMEQLLPHLLTAVIWHLQARRNCLPESCGHNVTSLTCFQRENLQMYLTASATMPCWHACLTLCPLLQEQCAGLRRVSTLNYYMCHYS